MEYLVVNSVLLILMAYGFAMILEGAGWKGRVKWLNKKIKKTGKKTVRFTLNFVWQIVRGIWRIFWRSVRN